MLYNENKVETDRKTGPTRTGDDRRAPWASRPRHNLASSRMSNRTHLHPVALALAACLLAAGTGPALAYRTENVVIVIIDGVRLSESFEDPTHQYIPRMWNELVPLGMRIPEFRNEGRTETVAGHAAILTGTWQELPDDGTIRPTMPTIYEYFRAATSTPITEHWIVAGKYKLHSLNHSTHPLYGVPYQACAFSMTRPDPYTYADYIARLAVFEPRISVLCLTQTDYDGHSGNWETYTSGIALADSLTADLWTWIESNPHFAGNTTMFVTSDHGRHLGDAWPDHGDECEGCRRVGFLAVGPDFVPGSVLEGTWRQIDIVPTIAELYEIPAALSTGTSFFRAGIALDPILAAAPGALIGPLELAPNPFNPLLRIAVDLRAATPVAVEVMDVRGRVVRSLWSGVAGPGPLAIAWDGRNENGAPQAAGVYTIVARGAGERSAQKAVLVK
jgi:hypothetical protein